MSKETPRWPATVAGALEEHNAIYALHLADAEKLYSGMSLAELLKWQAVLRGHPFQAPTHQQVACLEIIAKLLASHAPGSTPPTTL